MTDSTTTTPATTATPTPAANRPPFQRVARRVLLIALLASVGVLVLLGLLLLFDVRERYSGQAAGTAVVAGAWSLLGFATLKALDFSGRRGVRWGLSLGWAMATVSTLAAVVWLALIWLPMSGRSEENLARGGAICSIWTIECLLPLAFLSPVRLPMWGRAIVVVRAATRCTSECSARPASSRRGGSRGTSGRSARTSSSEPTPQARSSPSAD